jgi:hypothetical protein
MQIVLYLFLRNMLGGGRNSISHRHYRARRKQNYTSNTSNKTSASKQALNGLEHDVSFEEAYKFLQDWERCPILEGLRQELASSRGF